MASLWTLGYDIVANDRTSAGTSSAIRNLDSVGGVARNMAREVATSFINMGDAARRFGEQVNITSYSLGVASQNVRELALRYADASTSASEAAGTIDALVRAGVRQQAELDKTTGLFLDYADAVGENGATITLELVPAFKAWNISMSESGDQLDQLAYLVRNSTYDASTLAYTLEQVAPNLQRMNMGFEDGVAIIAAFADKGIDGRRMVLDLNSAIRAATPDIDMLNNKLETTTERLEDARSSGERLDTQIEQARRRVQEAYTRWQVESYQATDITSIQSSYNNYLDALDQLKELEYNKKKNTEEQAKLEEEKKSLEEEKSNANNPEAQRMALYKELEKYSITPEMIEGEKKKLAARAPGTVQNLAEIVKESFGPIDQLNAEVQKAVFNMGAGTSVETASQALGIAGDVGITALAMKALLGGGGGAAGAAAAAGAAGTGTSMGGAGAAAGAVGGGALLGGAALGLGLGVVGGLIAAPYALSAGEAAQGWPDWVKRAITVGTLPFLAIGGPIVDISTGNPLGTAYGAYWNEITGGGELFNAGRRTVPEEYNPLTSPNIPYANPEYPEYQPVQNNNITINIDKVSSDYDVDQLYARMMANMAKDAKRGGALL